MTNEEFERKMNFIVQRQAQVEIEWDAHRAWHLENDRKHQVWKAEIEDLLTRLARVTNEGFKDTNAKINALVDAQIRMEEEQRKTDEQLRQTGEQQRKTDEQLRQTDEQLRRTDELLRRHLGGKRNGENNN